MDALEIFAHNLRRERLARGLSQERLAELCDLHMTDVGRIERAERDPRLRTADKLARGLNLPLAVLVDPSTVPGAEGGNVVDLNPENSDSVTTGSSPATELPGADPPEFA